MYIWDRATIEQLIFNRHAAVNFACLSSPAVEKLAEENHNKFISKEDIEAYKKSKGIVIVSVFSLCANIVWIDQTTFYPWLNKTPRSIFY